MQLQASGLVDASTGILNIAHVEKQHHNETSLMKLTCRQNTIFTWTQKELETWAGSCTPHNGNNLVDRGHMDVGAMASDV